MDYVLFLVCSSMFPWLPETVSPSAVPSQFGGKPNKVNII